MASSASVSVPRPLALTLAALLFGGVILAGWHLHASLAYGRAASWALLSGAAFGFILIRSRFCFYCGLREFVEERDARPVLGLLAALATGTVGYLVILGAWLPFPEAGHLPPRAHLGPVGWHLALGGLTFGVGMALSGSCLSAHLYRLGEGSTLSPVALLGAIAGFLLGFNAWEFIYLHALTAAPVVWLPKPLGYAAAAALQLAALALLAFWVWRWGRSGSPFPAAAPSEFTLDVAPKTCGQGTGLPATIAPSAPVSDRSLRSLARAVFVTRWPAWVGGVLVGLLATAAYLRATPLGVTAELGRLARKYGGQAGLVPLNLPGLDGLAGCATADRAAAGLTPNALFVLGLVTAALASGLAAGHFQPERPSWPRVILALLGGLLLGFGSLISLGCSIGTLLSGIHAFSVSGWLFAAALVAGVYGGLKVRRALGQ